MRLGSTSITVTGIETPSSVKTRVMPHLRPTIPTLIFKPHGVRGFYPLWPPISERYTPPNGAQALLQRSAQTDLNINASCQIQLHQCVDGFFRRLHDIKKPLVGANLVLVTRILIDMRRNQHSKSFLASGQRDRAANLRACT